MGKKAKKPSKPKKLRQEPPRLLAQNSTWVDPCPECRGRGYGIFDSAGNAIDWRDSEAEARILLDEICRAEPAATGHIAAIGFDDEGLAFGDAIHPDRIYISVTVKESPFIVGSPSYKHSVPVLSGADPTAEGREHGKTN